MKENPLQKFTLVLEPLISKFRTSSVSDREMTLNIVKAILKNKSLKVRFLKCTHPSIRLTGNLRTEVLECKECGFSLLDK